MTSMQKGDREFQVQVNGDPLWDFQDSTPGGVLHGDSSEIGALLDRPTSAPPALEVSRDPFFAWSGSSGLLDAADQLRFGIGDVRLIPNYEKFYESRQDPSLPPPLERSPFASSPLFPDPNNQPRSSFGPHLTPFGAQQVPQVHMQQQPLAMPSPQIQQPRPSPSMNGLYPPQQRQSLPVAHTAGLTYPPMNPIEAQKYLAMMSGMGGMYITPGAGMPGAVVPGAPGAYMGPSMEQLQHQQQQQMMRSQMAHPQQQMSAPQQLQQPPQSPQSTPHPHIQTQARRNGMPQSASPKQKRRNTRDANENGQIWSGATSQPTQIPSAAVPTKNVIPRNKNIGKVAINSDSNLSSSTEDLLALAGKTHLRAFSSSPSPSTSRSPSLTSSNNTSVGGEADDPFFPPQKPAAKAQGHFGSSTMTELPQMIFPGGVPQMFDAPQTFAGFPQQTQQRLPVVHANANALPPVSGHGGPPTPAGAIVVPSSVTSVPSTPTSPTAGTAPPRLNLPMAPNGSPATQVCRYYAQGYCSRGEKCTFLHTADPAALADADKSAEGGKRSPRPISSPTRYLNMTLPECVGQIFAMCKDQHGCRFLQRKLDEDGAPAVTAIFNEVIDHIVDLMSDPFGNYLCQKLIEHSTNDQRLAIVRGVSPHIVAISKNMHGTRAVQKTIEFLGSAEEIRLVRDSLRGSVVALIQDLNGNHVIQKCLHKMEPNDNQFIYDAVAQHCVQVASHRHGCCVMQRCIEHASEAQKMQLVNEIKNNALALVQDAFGNYVVQYVLDLGMELICEAIATKFLGNLYYLSTQKFSSNVVEKCLKVGNARTIAIISRELAEFQNPNLVVGGDGHASQDLIIQLLQHPYGNYVVQTALQEALTKAPREWHMMANRIRPFLPLLRSTPYAKRVQGLLSPPKLPSVDDMPQPSPLVAPEPVPEPVEEKPIQPQAQPQQRRQPQQQPKERHYGPPKSRGGRGTPNNQGNAGNKPRNR